MDIISPKGGYKHRTTGEMLDSIFVYKTTNNKSLMKKTNKKLTIDNKSKQK